MKTVETEAFQRALHLSRLMPLGKDSKREAVHRWHAAVIELLKHKSCTN